MNGVQRAYALAKAAHEVAKSEADRIEHDFIVRHGIKDSDGTTPECLWTWDAPSEEAFDEALDLACKEGGEAAFGRVTAASKELRKAEDELLEYAISISPAGIRDALRHEVQWNEKSRDRLLDLAFRLDTRTVH